MRKSLVDTAFEIVLEFAFEFGCYSIGRVVILVISLGRWKCDPIAAFVPRRRLRVSGFRYLRGQKVYLTREATHLVGLINGVLLVCGGVLIWYFARR